MLVSTDHLQEVLYAGISVFKRNCRGSEKQDLQKKCINQRGHFLRYYDYRDENYWPKKTRSATTGRKEKNIKIDYQLLKQILIGSP